MSEAPGSLAAALAELQTQLPHVTKDAENPHFRSKYATLEAISAELLPLMGKLGLSFSAKPTMHERTPGEWVFVLLYSLRHAPSGEQDTGTYPLPTGTPQAIGSAITYARRYALQAITGMAPDEDDDGNAAENSQKPVKPASASRASHKTPAQQRAAGAPTGTPTQQREQRARRAEEERARAPLASPRPADRTKGPIPDEENIWQGDPEDRRGSVSPGQLRAIGALMGKADAKNQTDRHALIIAAIGGMPEDVTGQASTKYLSFREGQEVIKYLSEITGDAKMPPPRGPADAAANDDFWEGMNVQ